ncbi:MAG: YajQ family cyclic di-GMP-binding protein [Phycisphaerales bacterium]|nr:YajQ family cyclic di-GMP-binding protein [Phycisphaerales bacterium]
MATPTLDIVSKFNFAELDNAINNLKKMMATRFDFRGSKWTIEVDQKEKKLKIVAEDGTKHKGIAEELHKCAMRRGIDPKAFEYGETEHALGGMLKREVKLTNGLEAEKAKEITRKIKDFAAANGLKVQPSIQGDEIRLSGKQIDDLRTVMTMLQGDETIGVPLQFVNMKS